MGSAMGLTARIAEAAGIEVKRIGSLELVAWTEIDAFLKVVGAWNVAIIGIEGFRIEGTKAVPDMDAIADFSALPIDEEWVTATIAEANRFLSSVSRPSMYFDFELDEDVREA
jgi:hypothetical protein